jgi:hypothetical protein
VGNRESTSCGNARSGKGPAAFALLVYLAFAIVLMLPVLANPGNRVVGSPDFHVWDHVWHCWWAKYSLASGMSPFFCSLLDFPRGLHVAGEMSTLTFPFFSVPLQYAFGLVGAYNAMALACFALSAWGAFLVCRRFVSGVGACILAGTIYGFSPFLQVELANGMMEQVVGTAILPFFVLTLLSINARPGRGNVALAAVLIAMLALSSLYSVFFGFLLMGFIVWQAWGQTPPADRRRLLFAHGIVALSGVLVLSGVALGVALTSATLTRHGNWKGYTTHPLMKNKACVDVLRLFSLSATSGSAAAQGSLTLVPFGVYMGKVAAILSLAALAIRDRAWRPWKVGLLASILLALGPYLNVGGRIEHGAGFRIPLPDWLVLSVFPQATRLLCSHNYRFISVAMLFAGLLSALALQRGFSRLRIGLLVRGLVAGSLTALVLLDSGWSVERPDPLHMAYADAPIPAAYRTLASRPAGGVFDVPLPYAQTCCIGMNGRQMFYQTLHGRPIWAGGADITKPEKKDLAFVRAARGMSVGQDWTLSEQDLQRDGAELGRMGYRYIAVHGDMLSKGDNARVRELATECLGGPVADADGVAIYELRSDNAAQ